MTILKIKDLEIAANHIKSIIYLKSDASLQIITKDNDKHMIYGILPSKFEECFNEWHSATSGKPIISDGKKLTNDYNNF